MITDATSHSLPARIRWWLWHLVSRLPGICPVSAQAPIIRRSRRDPRIDSMCTRGGDGACYCGKLRQSPGTLDRQQREEAGR